MRGRTIALAARTLDHNTFRQQVLARGHPLKKQKHIQHKAVQGQRRLQPQTDPTAPAFDNMSGETTGACVPALARTPPRDGNLAKDFPAS